MLETPEQRSDAIIAGMAATGVATALIPAPVGLVFMAAVASGVVAIGACYGVEMTKEQAWKLVIQFFKAAGLTYMALNVGWVFISGILTMTGAGHVASVVLDATQATAISYGVGYAAKAYFSGERRQKELGKIVREQFVKVKARERAKEV